MLTPETLVDRYTVEALLGEGGMAVVYKVRHNRLGTYHAMKVLKIPHASVQDRMLREGQVQAQLRHPNIVSVTDIIEVDGSPGLVMEYIEGSDLHELVYDRRLSLEQIDAIAVGIIEGVGAAHALGLVHRDLKPANILLAPEGRNLVPKITDFGLAKVLSTGTGDRGQTRTGISMGTPSYMAPEQIRNARDVDERADIFSLGAILYELLANQRAYDSDDLLEVFNAVANGERTPIEDLRPDAPPRMVHAVKQCLEVDRTKRPQTCEALLEIWNGGDTQDNALLPFDSEMFERIRSLGSGTNLRPVQPETYHDPDPLADEPTKLNKVNTLASADTIRIPLPPMHTDVEEEADQSSGPSPLIVGLSAAVVLLLLGTIVLSMTVFAGFVVTKQGNISKAAREPIAIPAPAPAPAPAIKGDAPSPEPETPPSPVAPAPPPRPPPVPRVRPRPRRNPPAPVYPQLKVVGGATVSVRGSGRTYHAGDRIPPGDYEFVAVFPSGDENRFDLKVSPGESSLVFSCNPSFYTCDRK